LVNARVADRSLGWGVLALVSRIFSFALERELVESNPALQAQQAGEGGCPGESPWRAGDRGSVGRPQRVTPTVAAAWRLILVTGQRPVEVMRLRRCDLDRDLAG
jgi:integrase